MLTSLAVEQIKLCQEPGPPVFLLSPRLIYKGHERKYQMQGTIMKFIRRKKQFAMERIDIWGKLWTISQ